MTIYPIVCVVDDDESVREALVGLIRSAGFDVRAFASAEDFLARGALCETQCLILDVQMPGMSGPALQEHLASRGGTTPIVFITAWEEESVRARLLECGAIAYLVKPFGDNKLLDAVRTATRSKDAPRS